MSVLRCKSVAIGTAVAILFILSGVMQAGLRIAIDVPINLRKSFSGVRNYILQGYRAQHRFGISHLIADMLKAENAKRAKEGMPPMGKNFAIEDHKNLYLVLGYIDEPSDKARIEQIKKSIGESVGTYKKKGIETEFNFKVLPKAHFSSKRPGELEIVQNVFINKGGSAVDQLMGIIKNNFTKHKIKFGKLGFGVYVNYAKIKSKDENFIKLVKNNDAIANHLESVRPPRGADKGFATEHKIHIYDGAKRLASYDV